MDRCHVEALLVRDDYELLSGEWSVDFGGVETPEKVEGPLKTTKDSCDQLEPTYPWTAFACAPSTR